MPTLTEKFLAGLPPSTRASLNRGALEQELAALVARAGTGGWWGITPERFVRHVAERIGSGANAPALDAIHADELLLVCACLDGSKTALAELDARFLSPLARSLARRAGSAAAAEEIVQGLRERLLVGTASRAAGLTSYGGTGSLANWLKVTALRRMIKTQAREEGHAAATEPEQLARRAAPSTDLELGHLRRSLRPAFGSAFTAALAKLTTHQRLVLRQRFLDGLSLDELAKLHDAHRVTVSRWLATIRTQMVDEVQRLLRQNLDLSAGEVKSVLRLVHSHLELSIGDYLDGGG